MATLSIKADSEAAKAWREAKRRRDELRAKIRARGVVLSEESLPQPEIHGAGVIRDKHGNIKAHITLGPVREVNSFNSSEVK